jgi:hypothetical protein
MLTEVVTRVTAFWDWTTHDPVSFYTAVLALSMIALWIVTWRGIRGQSKDIRILQRAYVSVEPGGLMPTWTGLIDCILPLPLGT